MSFQLPPGEPVMLSISLLKEGVPQPEEFYPLWAERNLERKVVPATRYDLGGAFLVIPCEYDRILGQLREWRAESASRGISEMPTEHPLYAYHDRALPEEVAEVICSVPAFGKPFNGYVTEVQMLDGDSAQDAYLRQFDPDHQSAFGSDKNQTVYMFKPRSGLLLGRQYLHEWWHLVKWEHREDSYRFDLADYLERDGFFADQYGRQSADENWACHAASELCNKDLGRATAFANRAPLRTACILMTARDHVVYGDPTEFNPQEEILARNIDALLAPALEKSREILCKIINDGSEEQDVLAAVKLLLEIGTAEDFATITRPLELLEFQQINLSLEAAQNLARLPEVRHLKMRCVYLTESVCQNLAAVRGLRSLTLHSSDIDEYDLRRLAHQLKSIPTFQRLELMNHYPELSENTRHAIETYERPFRDPGTEAVD